MSKNKKQFLHTVDYIRYSLKQLLISIKFHRFSESCLCPIHEGQLQTGFHLPRFCTDVYNRILQRHQLGQHFQRSRCQVCCFDKQTPRRIHQPGHPRCPGTGILWMLDLRGILLVSCVYLF